MLTLHLSSLVKFLIGILFLQGSTGLLLYTALRTDLSQTWPLFGALGIALAAMAALWFNAIADNARKVALANAQASFSREREKIRVRAEQEKAREVKNTQRQAERQQQRARVGGQLKTGLLIAGGAGAALLLLMTQMISLGMLALTTAGGAAIGYGVRARQDRLGKAEGALQLGGRDKPVQALTGGIEEAQLVEPRPRKRAAQKILLEPEGVRPLTERGAGTHEGPGPAPARGWETD